MCSRSSLLPYPCEIAHCAPFLSTFLASCCESFRSLRCEPTPDGMFANRVLTSVSSLLLISILLNPVLSNLTPQLISYPTPPGETTPSSISNAATPPIGNPYPQ